MYNTGNKKNYKKNVCLITWVFEKIYIYTCTFENWMKGLAVERIVSFLFYQSK